jgi:hypothetical protein
MAEPTENNKSDLDAIKSIFKLALEMRNFEIMQLAQRNNFFMIFQGVLFAGVVQSSHQFSIISFLVCAAGLIVSLLQVGMASGAKYWQEYWEAALQMSEKLLLSHLEKHSADRNILVHLFHDEEALYEKEVGGRLRNHGVSGITYRLVMARFSVSRIPIYVGIALSIVWLLLLLSTMREYSPFGVPSFITGFPK